MAKILAVTAATTEAPALAAIAAATTGDNNSYDLPLTTQPAAPEM